MEEAKSLRQDIDREMRSLVQSIHFKLSDVSERPFGRIHRTGGKIEFPLNRQSDTRRSVCVASPEGCFSRMRSRALRQDTRRFNRLSEGLLVVSQPKGWEGQQPVCDASHEDWYVSPEYRTFRCKPELLDAQYLAALLPTPWFQRELTKLTRGQGARRERLRPKCCSV